MNSTKKKIRPGISVTNEEWFVSYRIPPYANSEYKQERKRALLRYKELCEDYNFDMLKPKVMLP